MRVGDLLTEQERNLFYIWKFKKQTRQNTKAAKNLQREREK